MIVQDISFKQYLALEDRTNYDYLLAYGKLEPLDLFCIGDFMQQSFEFVKDLQYLANSSGLDWESYFKEMSKFMDRDIEELADNSVFDLHRSRKYCVEEVRKINKIESDFLGYDPSPEEEQADIRRFSSYGAFLQYDKLAGGILLKYEEVKKLRYDLCFTYLKLLSDKDSFQADYDNVIKNKMK
jgi:hypothetical protein